MKSHPRHRSLFATAVALTATAALTGPALARPTMIDICHLDQNTGEYVLIRAPQAAADAHFAKHDDLAPTADGECVQPPVLLARAYETLPDGSQRTIAQFVDTDETGTPTAGDVIEVLGLPDDFDPTTPLIPVEIGRHVLPEGFDVLLVTPTVLLVSWTRDDGSGGGDYVRFLFDSTSEAESYLESTIPAGVASFVVSGGRDYFDPSLGNDDFIQLSPDSPSTPQAGWISYLPNFDTAATDDPFLEVDIFITTG